MRIENQLRKGIWLGIIVLFSIFRGNTQLSKPTTITWTVNKEIRKALVYLPITAVSKKSPIIFAFHGHGGTMQTMYRARNFQKLWPEAIVVCPQGLPTIGLLTDPHGEKSGWSMDPFTAKNRDLEFFDAMLQKLRAVYKIDNNRIYATGHSNGGGHLLTLGNSTE